MSATATAALLVPLAVGVKVTLIVQLEPAATLAPQLFVSAKSPLLVPVSEMPEIVTLVLPVLLRVATWAALVVPTV